MSIDKIVPSPRNTNFDLEKPQKLYNESPIQELSEESADSERPQEKFSRKHTSQLRKSFVDRRKNGSVSKSELRYMISKLNADIDIEKVLQKQAGGRI